MSEKIGGLTRTSAYPPQQLVAEALRELPTNRLCTICFGSGRSTSQPPRASSELPIEQVAKIIGADRVETVLAPHDCSEGFGPAYWCRPAAYLKPDVRACISGLARLPMEDLEPGLERLRQDLDTVLGKPATEISLLLTPSTPACASSCGRARDRVPHGNSHLSSTHRYQFCCELHCSTK